MLPPNAPCALWAGLRELRDPWFLTHEDDRGSFRDLANRHTAKIIHEFLHDQATGVHLKIAVLEAIANSTENIGLHAIIRDMVREKHDNTWLRSTALKAFAKSVQNDWSPLEALDGELAQATDDLNAPDVRVDLLLLTQNSAAWPRGGSRSGNRLLLPRRKGALSAVSMIHSLLCHPMSIWT